MSRPSPILGIDLGTTFSLAAVVEEGKPVVLRNGIGELLTSSAVSIGENGEVFVGAAARARLTTHPGRTAVAFKRDMGTDRVHDLGGRKLSAVELSALVLGAIKRDAEALLGRPIEEAVVTVPAYFGDRQRQATRDAAAIAGLRAERIINEPTAAALAYGLHQRDCEMRVAVLDLGGGTFDVTVLEIIEGVVEIQASAGDVRLGGEDFDATLARFVARAIRERHGIDPEKEPGSWARLRDACEWAKKRLGQDEQTHVVLPALRLGERTHDVEVPITRADAESEWGELLARLRLPIEQALRDAGVRPQQIDEVLLVGGSTRMPCVQQVAAQLFGKLPLRSLPADEAVALGAAIQGALKAGDESLEDLVVTDVAPFSLGVRAATQVGRRFVGDVFIPVLERGTVIPASRVERFFTVGDFQREIVVEVFQGEHSECSANQKLGDYTLGGLPPMPAGEQGVDIRFSYDINGILEVELTVVSTGKNESFVLEQRPGKLTPAEIAETRHRLAGLKLHPRDALPNTTCLARADALFVELTGPARAGLGEAIAAMRAALESQDPVGIGEMRGRLNSMIDASRGTGRPRPD